MTGVAFSGWSIYHTACFLAAGVGNFDVRGQQQFKAMLLNYIWIFMVLAAVLGSLFHFYVMKRLIQPIRKLIASTKQLKSGHYPEPVQIRRTDEVGQLVGQYNSLLEQLQRNEEHRKKLVHDLSHEIRTPLSNLKGYLQALKDGAIEGEPTLYEALYSESARLTEMVEQLEHLKEWDYVSAQTLVEKNPYEIKELLGQCVAMFNRRLEAENIQVQLEAERCEVMLHIEGFQQVMSNLLDNAIRYYEGTKPIVLTGKQKEGSYMISITGPSQIIPKDEREAVFRRFYRLDASRSRMTGGSGLGLAISKEVIERHQGEIGVREKNNQNEFWFSLPLNTLES